jgi:hypothetical protein
MQRQLGTPHSILQYLHPCHLDPIRGSHPQEGHWDWARSEQYEQTGGFLSQQVMEASHHLPQKTSWTCREIHKAMHFDALSAAYPQCYCVNARSVALAFPPRQRFYTGSGSLSATCSSIFTDPTPLLSIDFPCGPLSLLPYSSITGCFRLVAEPAATCWCWFLARGFFYPEDGGYTFLRNLGLHKIYTAPHPRRRHSSVVTCSMTRNSLTSYNLKVHQHLHKSPPWDCHHIIIILYSVFWC